MTSPAWTEAAAVYEAGGTLPPVPAPAYIYNATIVSVHDGDTITVAVSLGFDCTFTTNIRLVGCNAIELSQPGGKEAGDNLRALLPPGTRVTIASDKVDKFGGRYDSSVTYLASDGTPHDLVADLIAQNWAAPWNGVGKAPVPPWPRPVAGKRTPAEYVARARQRMLDAGEDPDRPVFACDPPAESTIGQQIEQSQEYARRAYGSGTEQ